ncbi:MAG TPA: RidA family protein [Candidatus Binatia bacterium]|jgi:enamine deaminase RidA (YjgF/YER057c/UK114 family)
MTSGFDARLRELGIELPPVFQPVANYLGCKRAGALLFVGGHGPTTPGGVVRGKVGKELSIAEAKAAARATGLSMLATIRAELGSLDRVRQIVEVFGMVNCAPGFNRTPEVIDGCSDLLVEVFGEAGRHTRAAVGMAELPFDIPVEIRMTIEVE